MSSLVYCQVTSTCAYMENMVAVMQTCERAPILPISTEFFVSPPINNHENHHQCWMPIQNSSFLASSSSSSRAMGMAVTPTMAFASSQSTTTTFLICPSASGTLTSSSSLIKTSSVSYTPIFRRSSSLRKTTTTTTTLCSSSSDKGVSEKLHKNTIGTMSTRAGVPVFVMMPLDTVSTSGKLNKVKTMNASLAALRTAGVEGVMVDVWWGLVEKDGPLNYNWKAYVELVDMVRNHGLKLQMVMSFHQCGGNVGDSCSIPLPSWVLEEMRRDPDIVYTDRSGRRNPEYISLGCDNLPVLKGRTPIQVYSDYMRDFRQKFQDYLGDTIVEIQVGTGPCGELRYPSYPESNATWRFPGIGEFQCYDKYMMASLKAAAIAAGHEEWGHGGPHDAGNYNQYPEETGFFRSEGTWNSDYGKFFLEWYSGMLLDHGDRIFSAAQGIFSGTGAKLSAKVAGIHWHYKSRTHPSELTAGYYNTRDRDGYIPMAKMFANRGVVLNFTCMEMRDEEQQFSHANSSPELLVKQVKLATKAAGVHLAGENALERYDGNAYSQVLATSKDLSVAGLCAFTYLRMNKRLFEGENWREFVGFVRSMSYCSGQRPQFLSPECPPVVGFDHGNYDRRKPESKMAASK